MMRNRLAALLATCVAAACGDSIGVDDVDFPSISSAVLTAFCWQGNIIPPVNRTGVISSADCDAADIEDTDEGYYEVWRVRVATARTLTITATSSFDNYLTVVRVNSISGTTVNGTIVAEDDDGGSGLNAMVTVTLQPNTDYFVAVSGYDYAQVGSYSLSIN